MHTTTKAVLVMLALTAVAAVTAAVAVRVAKTRKCQCSSSDVFLTSNLPRKMMTSPISMATQSMCSAAAIFPYFPYLRTATPMWYSSKHYFDSNALCL